MKDQLERTGFDKALTIENFSVVGFFFFNILFLPTGLLYTTLMTPWFLWLLLRRRHWKGLAWYFLLSLPLAWYHLSHGAVGETYLRSYFLFTSVAVFTLWAWHYFRQHARKLGGYFRQISIYNSFFTLFALALYFTAAGKTIFWSFEPIHPAIPVAPRLKMLVYEPSFYALQLAPVILFYFIAYLFSEGNRYLLGLVFLTVSLLLSLSFGVIGGLTIALTALILLHFFRLIRRKKVFYAGIYLALILVAAVVALFWLFPLNPVADRVEKVWYGFDPSANGRTWQAFLLAWKILGETSYLFGAGLGQIKEIGHEIIVNYYNYEGAWADLVRIPNVMAETLATFGLAGALTRLIAQIGLFFYTRVYSNYYRFALFIFLFLYQFTGSYLTNVYEYLFWVLVFLPVFPQFDKAVVHDLARQWKE